MRDSYRGAVPALALDAPPLSDYALDLAMERVLARRAPSLSAFVVTERGGERELHEFPTEGAGRSASLARYHLRTLVDVDRAVLVWDGYVMCSGKRVDAVLAEHCEFGAEASTIVARRYRPAGRFRAALPLGVTIEVGEGHPLF